MSSRPANDHHDVQHEGFFSQGLGQADSAIAEAIAAVSRTRSS
jgi:hypothetical protein